MFTSNFARIDRIPSGIRIVGIAVGPPRWYHGECMKELAPTKEMLSMSTKDYIVAFQKRLDALDPQSVFNSLGDNTVMLCWESPGVFCHRRAVAQWLESSLGIVIPEFGFDRDAIPSYPDMPEKDSVEAKQLAKQLAKRKPTSYIPTLLS